MIDVQTRKSLKPNSAVVPDSSSNFGSAILQLEPSLERINEGREDMTLRSAVWLIRLDRPLQRRIPGYNQSS